MPNIKLIIEIDPKTENMADAVAAAARMIGAVPVETAVKPATAEVNAVDEAPFNVPEPEVKVTKSDILALATKLSKAGKKETLAKIFAEFGAAKLSDIAESDYPKLSERLGAAL